MFETWLSFRDSINNKLIRFLLRHCGLDSVTTRAFVRKIELLELEALTDEKCLRRDIGAMQSHGIAAGRKLLTELQQKYT